MNDSITVKYFNELVSISKGKKPRNISLENLGSGYLPYILIESFNRNYREFTNDKSCTRVVSDDIEIVWDGERAGLVSMGHDGYLGSTLAAISIISESLNSNFLFYFLQSKQAYFRYLAEGTGVPHISRWSIENLEIPLLPIENQKKIASILTSVDEVIENTQRQIDKLQDLKKATMNELLTKGIGHTEFKDSELGRIPKSWEVLFLHKTKNENDRYSFTGGPFGSNLKNCDFTKNGVRIIQLQNIGDGNFLNEYKIYTSSQKADELISCNIYPGDIILSKMGDPVARATIIPDIETRYIMSSDGIRLSINKKKFDLKFILESINHHSTRNQAKVLSIGSTRQRIGLTDIRKLLIRVPQLDEQKKISSVINSIDFKIKKINQKLIKTKLLKKSLMQELLTGKVRVSVN
jgi:type I restriction enzyme S subunit